MQKYVADKICHIITQSSDRLQLAIYNVILIRNAIYFNVVNATLPVSNTIVSDL